ncbi:MAG: DUF6734 family protein, partial [Chthoniobacterales bacterium]
MSGKGNDPKVAIYTVRTANDGALRGWPDTETGVGFISQSVQVSRRHFETAVLHTDKHGKELLKNASFDEVITSLDGFDIEPNIFNAAKLDSCNRQSRPFLHIDWDFILWKCSSERLQSPVVAQSRDVGHGKSRISLIWHSLRWKPSFISDFLENEIPIEMPYASVLGGMDVEFLHGYSQLALEILRHPKNQFIHSFAQGELANDIC